MRDDEGDKPAKRAVVHEIGCDLSAVSLEELGERVDALRREIDRIRAEEARKRASRDAAAAFFRG